MVAVVVLIVVIVNVAGGGGEEAQQVRGGGSAEEPATASIGDEVKSGDIQFTVTDVRTEQSVSDPLGGNEKARGKYVIVDIMVRNAGESPFDFFADTVPLIDQQSNEYTSTVDVALTRGGTDLIEPINPGSTANGYIAYDVPESVKVKKSHIEVSGGLMGEPVSINLTK